MQFAENPDKAWSVMQVKQKVEKVTPVSPDSPKPPNHTRFVCISDTHTKTTNLKIPNGDVLLHGGDFSNVGLERDIKGFRAFLDSLPHEHKVIIAGNHDLTFDTANYPSLYRRFGHPKLFDCESIRDIIIKAPNVTYLEDSETTINGIRIWGSPWQPVFCDWAFNLERGKEIQKKWDLIPEGVDILITHGPPIGHGDLCAHGGRAGCVNLLHTIQTRVKPKYHVFGHIHEGYGITTDGVTQFVNASTCNFNYRPIQPAVVFDVPNKS